MREKVTYRTERNKIKDIERGLKVSERRKRDR